MSSKERFWDKQGQEQPFTPENGLSLPLGIFIDDEGYFSEKWEGCFKIPGFATIRPDVPSTLEDQNVEQTMNKIIKFITELSEDQLIRAAIVVVDQFKDNPSLFKASNWLVQRVRRCNSKAWILETSGWTNGLVFQGSNAELFNAKVLDAQNLVKRAPETVYSRILAFKTYTNDAFIQAGLADPSFGESDFDREDERERSFNELLRRKEIFTIFDILGEGKSLSYNMFERLNPERQKLLLHFCWNIVGCLQLGKGIEIYGGSLTRLQQLLE